MQITKQQALSLIKVLSHYNSITSVGNNYPIVNDDIGEFIKEFEEFVLDNDNVRTISNSFRIDGDIDPNILNDLQDLNGHINNSCVGDSGEDVTLRFKKVINDGGEIDTFLCVNKEVIGPVTYVRLFDRELQIAVGQGDERDWNYFDVEKIPSNWSTAFGYDGSVLRVINWE